MSTLLLFGAKDENDIDSVTLDVKNVEEFVASMDEVTGGRFLRGEEKGLSEEWKEMGWLKERGYFSMEEFAANKIEVALRRGWSKGKWKGGESAFWRKKGCVDWWVGLEEKVRRNFCQEFFGKAAKLLVNEIVERKDIILNNKFDFFKLEAELPKNFVQKTKKPVGRSFSFGMPHHLVKLMNKLVVIQEIYSILLACQLNKVETEMLFFSKVQSVLTVSDCVLRKFRELVMAVSIDHVSQELLGEEKMTNLPKKNEEKKVNKKFRKGKKNKRNSKYISSLPNSSASKPAATEIVMTDECMAKCINGCSYKLSDQDGDISFAPMPKDPGKENVKVIADKKNPTDRKRGKRTSIKHKNSKKMVDHETENIQTLLPVVFAKDKVGETTLPILSDSVANNDNCITRPLSNEKHRQALTSSLSDTGSEMTSSVSVDKHMNSNSSHVVGNSVNSIHTQHMDTSVNEQSAALLHNNVHANCTGGTSHEWPRTTPHHLSSCHSNHLPPATDRLHLDVGHKLPNHFNQPFIPLRHSARNSPSLKMPINYDWPQVVNNFDIYDLKTKSEFPDDADYWLSEEEIDLHAISGRDFNQYFGGGVMYWNTAEHAGPGFSRPPSHSSEDNSWAWYEADMNRAIDDMIGMPGLSFDHNGDLLEDGASVSLNNPASCAEGIKIDTLPYTMLRPIIVPRISREKSQSEFNSSHDLNSPCMPSTSRSDHPRTKRPPSPVVLCVPRVPHPPPPSPVGESRRRGFPIVRSGSSSPRHWGMRGCYYEDGIISDDPRLCLDGAEVVRPSWVTKGQPFKGPLLQNHLIKEHPDVALPLQPPDSLNCPHKASLSMLHNVLNEEIDLFCKQVAAENLIKRPYVNWAVKTATRALQDIWPRSRANIFGSNATGLALPSSDVDLVVSLPPVRNLEPIKEAGILEGRNGIKETCLQHAARYLANQEWVRNDSLKTIENTAIPIIMLVAEVPQDINYCDEQSSLEAQRPNRNQSKQDERPSTGSLRKNDGVVNSVRLDISFKTPSHTGIQTSKLVKELTQQFPASVPLALVLKKFLADRSLDHSYSGGLSSYCLVLLITRFLQHEHHIGRPVSQNLGSLLMDFLYFFGYVFDPRQMRISIQGSGVYMKRERGLSIDPIHIDDPLFPSNNVGRNCFRIHQCIKAFADAYTLLESELSHFVDENGPCTTEPFELLRKIIPSIARE